MVSVKPGNEAKAGGREGAKEGRDPPKSHVANNFSLEVHDSPARSTASPRAVAVTSHRRSRHCH